MTNILIALVSFLVIVTCVQVIRVSELLSEIRGKDVNDVTDQDNKIQSRILIIVGMLFLGFVVWQIFEWKHLVLPPASSEHGEQIDVMMNFTMGLILTVFFITTPILFFFGYKYRGKKGNKAYHYAHNNKLEIIWTIVPTIVLTGVIIFGLQTWDKAMNVDTTNSKIIEVYSQQFKWTARYSGEDNTLGKSHFRLVDGMINPLGVDMNDASSQDDKITKEVHLVVDQPVVLKFRSQDVIHSAYLPHFRVQMNCVPGITTQFAFTPTKTTTEMKEQEGGDFDYVLLCNKICGSAHFNMQMKFIVETQEEYDDWINQQETISQKLLTQNTN